MDVFGYPGATVAGWKNAKFEYFNAWFTQPAYQLVMLEFGTNEGNVKPFDVATYRATLVESVRNMRATFPAAACILMAPGDRGGRTSEGFPRWTHCRCRLSPGRPR